MALSARYLFKYHHIFYDNFFASVPLANDFLRRKIYCCSTFRTNRKGWPKNFSSKKNEGSPKMRHIGNECHTPVRLLGRKKTCFQCRKRRRPSQATKLKLFMVAPCARCFCVKVPAIPVPQRQLLIKIWLFYTLRSLFVIDKIQIWIENSIKYCLFYWTDPWW